MSVNSNTWEIPMEGPFPVKLKALKCAVLVAVNSYMMIIMMMAMMIFFCGMVGQRKAFTLIFSQDHCHRFSSSRISDTAGVGFEPAQRLSSSSAEWNCSVMISATPRRRGSPLWLHSNDLLILLFNLWRGVLGKLLFVSCFNI